MPGFLSLLLTRIGLRSQTLREMLEAGLKEQPEADAAFSTEEREMLRRLLRFGALRVEDIIVPRADIIAIEESEPLSELLRTFGEAGVSRIPLFNETLDDPRGMIHIRDLMSWITEQANGDDKLGLGRVDLKRSVGAIRIARELIYVPASMSVLDLLLKMQSSQLHLALVVDEYGGTDGLVSIEDLVEEIVGEIADEHDVEDEPLIHLDPRLGLICDARTPVEDLEKHLKIDLVSDEQEEDIDTLGGVVFSIAGRIPARGELVAHPSGIEFEVLDADPRRIKKLRVHVPKDKDPANAGTGTDAKPEQSAP